MSLLSALMIYPFFFALTTSLKDSPEVFSNILKPLGEALRFDNYETVLSSVNMGRYLVNTANRGGLCHRGPDHHLGPRRVCLRPHQLPGPGH